MSIKLPFSVACILCRRILPDITQLLNVYVIHIRFFQNASFLRKLNPLIFALNLLNLLFSRPLQLMKIISTEWYVYFFFFLARTYRARIQLSFINTRGIQYSPYIHLCVLPYRVPNLTLGTKYKFTNEH